jgi:hypothetical protein
MDSKKLTARQRQAVLTDYMRSLGRQGGLASAAASTPAQRKERAAKAGRARQAKWRQEVLNGQR